MVGAVEIHMEQQDQQDQQPNGDYKLEVCQNVLIFLSIPFFLAMILAGYSLFQDCPSQIMLAPYAMVQGLFGLVGPILYAIKHGAACRQSFEKRRTCFTKFVVQKIPFFTIIILDIVITLCLLTAGIHWLAASDCSDSILVKANIVFVVIVWLAVMTPTISRIAFLVWKCKKAKKQIREETIQ